MADFSDEFKTYLKTISAITDDVGSGTAARIYPDRLREGATMPAIVYVEAGGGESFEFLGGISGLAETVMHVYTYGSTRTQANDLAEVVRLAPLQGFGGTMGATAVTSVSASSHRDTGFDPPRHKTDKPKYWTRRIYNLHHAEATS